MKKFIIFAAIAGTALAGCAKQEPLNVAAGDTSAPISFSALAAPSTKAVPGEMPAAYNTSEKFVAYAGWTEAVYDLASNVTEFFTNNFTNAICSYDATLKAWKPATTYYWPKTGYLTFEAFSPADALYHSTISHTWANGFTFTDFAIRGGIKDQYDLLYSDRVLNKQRANYDVTDGSAYDDENDTNPKHSYNGVDILFHHALSSIVFKVKTKQDYSNVTITLTGLTINNADSKGTFTENVTDGDSFVAAPSWDKAYATADEATYNVFDGTTPQTVTSTSQPVSPLVGSASNIILLPQDLAHASTSKDVTVTVSYTIAQHGGAALPQTSTITLKNLTESSVAVGEWKMGKRYIYTIVFGLDEIYFDPKVVNWTEVNMDAYELTY